MSAPFGTVQPRALVVCFWHGYEPGMPGDYWTCGECWHIWRTPEEFAADVHAWLTPEESPDPTPENTPGCPRCAHDW